MQESKYIVKGFKKTTKRGKNIRAKTYKRGGTKTTKGVQMPQHRIDNIHNFEYDSESKLKKLKQLRFKRGTDWSKIRDSATAKKKAINMKDLNKGILPAK
jgi:hypothetical protein